MTAADPRLSNSISFATKNAVNPGPSRFVTPNLIMKKFQTLLLAALCLPIFSAAAAVPTPDKILPDDTLVVFTIPDYARLRDIYTSSPQGQLWNDTALKPFRDKLMGKFQSDIIAPMEKEMGIKLDDYTSLPQGQITLAVIQNGWMGHDTDPEPAFIALVDTKDQSSQLKDKLSDLRKKWVDAGKPVRNEKIRDIDFSVIVISTNDLPKPSKKKAGEDAPPPAEKSESKPAAKTEIFVGQVESLLIVGSNAKAVEKIIARMCGVKPLSEVPAFDSLANSMFRDAPIYGWVNAKAFVDAMMISLADETKSANALGIKPEAIFSALGLTGLKTLAFNFRNTSEGSGGNFLIGVPESSRTGLFKILAGEPKECLPPPFVPGDVVHFERIRIDGQKLWAGIRKIASDISPQAAGTIDFMLGSVEENAKEKDPSFDIKKNLFGNLGDDIIFYEKNPRGSSAAEIASAPYIYLIASPNADQLLGAIKSLMVMLPTGAPNEREFLGRKIYTITSPSAGPKGAPSSGVSMSSSGGYVVIGPDAAMLEEYLRSNQGQGKPLRETPGLVEASQKVLSSGSSIFSFANDGESMRFLFDVIKKESNSDNAFGTMGQALAAAGIDTAKVKEWVDISLLPAYDRVSKYFYMSVWGVTPTADGIMLKAFSPVPPLLKK